MRRIAEHLVLYHTLRLESGIDFDVKKHVEKSGLNFRIKESRLEEIARANGYSECERCNVMQSVNDRFVNAVFSRKIH